MKEWGGSTTYAKALYLLKVNEGTHGNLCQDSRCPGLDWNRVLPDYKSEALLLEVTCSFYVRYR
jgi:hypothetical protein